MVDDKTIIELSFQRNQQGIRELDHKIRKNLS